jgi:uncharacterized membrane protein YdjX (TVP38/TMEM64 family)
MTEGNEKVDGMNVVTESTIQEPGDAPVVEGPNPSSTAQSGTKWILIGAVVVVAGFLLWYFDAKAYLQQALAWVEGLGPAAPIVFGLLYIVACVLSLPGSVLTLGAGALFGVVTGSIVVSISSTLGATASFLIGRYLARDAVARKTEGNARFKAIDEAVGREGWKIVGLLRLSPLFPFNLLNYGLGLTKVSLRDYFLASWIGMMPGTIMYVYLGSLVNVPEEATTGQTILKYVGLAATILVTVYITKIAKKALAEKVSREGVS